MGRVGSRQGKDFLTSDELGAVIGRHNNIFDPHSLLISSGVEIGQHNTFYPNVVIELSGAGRIKIGDGNIFYPGTYILSSLGSIKIGDNNELGTGGCSIKANVDEAKIIIGDNGRYCGNTSIMGKTTLGSGSQVLGDISVQSCILAEGGGYGVHDADKRGAVLKGAGLARGLSIKAGQVINGWGDFSEATVEWQRTYHPKSQKRSD